MKKRKYLCILIAIIITATSICINASATQSDIVTNNIENRINLIINNSTTYEIIDQVALKSLNNSDKYICYSLSPYGYAILNTETNSFEEISPFLTETPYDDITSDCYYFGPQKYYYMSETGIVNCKTNEELTFKEYNDFVAVEAKRDSLQEFTSTLDSSELATVTRGVTPEFEFEDNYVSHKNYFTSLLQNHYPNNQNGTCTIVACAIMLGYYNYYSPSNYYIDSEYCDGCGTNQAFHDLLCTYMNNGPTGLALARRGIIEYLEDRGRYITTCSVKIGSSADVFSSVKEKIDEGNPLVAAMFESYGADYNHSVVVYGYSTEYDNTLSQYVSRYYYTHNGWLGSSDATNFMIYNYSVFADCLYLG